jgi:hypothetical protein
MAEHNPKKITPPDPILLSPVDEALIDGRSVQFTWEPVDHAVEYRLEISEESTFDTLVLEETITGGTTTALNLAGRFPTDEVTLFWRVMARNDAGWSPGDRVESFISGTQADAALHLKRPDDDEHYGPFPQLIKSGAAEVAGEVTGKEKFFAQEEAEGVQHEGVETGQILGIFIAVVVAVILMIITVFALVDNLQATTRLEYTGMSGYPELQQVTEQGETMLSQYGIVDDSAGQYRIPIDSAMQRTVQAYQGRTGTLSTEIPGTEPLQGGAGLEPEGQATPLQMDSD